jgi:hypothetical protein
VCSGTLGNGDAHVGQGFDLARVVGHQAQRLHAQVLEHRQAHGVVTLVGGETQALVGFDGVGAAILQLVGADLVQQADATAFLAQVQQHATAFTGDGLQAASSCEPQSQRWLNSASPVRHSECRRPSTGAPSAISPRLSTTCSRPLASSRKPCMVNVAKGVGSLEAATKTTGTGVLLISVFTKAAIVTAGSNGRLS